MEHKFVNPLRLHTKETVVNPKIKLVRYIAFELTTNLLKLLPLCLPAFTRA